MKPETKKLVDEANRLHALCAEVKAAKARYWADYHKLGDAVEAANTHEEWWAARDVFRRHYQTEAPDLFAVQTDWRRACYAAQRALSAEVGLELGEIFE